MFLSYIVFCISLCHKFFMAGGICQNIIFCQGELLHTIQTATIFQDSKTFVDMNLVYSVDDTIKNFDNMMARTNNNPKQAEIKLFMKEHFQAEDGELELWRPKDYKPNPAFLNRIGNGQIKAFARDMVSIWPTLGRRIKLEVFKKLDRYSIIPVPNGFIIPGGRFREIYYWDSYWIIRGLLICEMSQTVRGILENFFQIIIQYGFVPNGGRIYYLDRSQPPLLTKMVNEYIEYTQDWGWLRQNIRHLETELQFWLESKMIEVSKDNRVYTMAIYGSFSDEPRPESYIEDVRTAQYWHRSKDRRKCYKEIRSGAESGLDFSTRWFFELEDAKESNLSGIEVTRIIPVDLNCFLADAFRIMGKFYKKLKNPFKAAFWDQTAIDLEDAIEHVLYNKEESIWYDYDRKLGKHRKHFYPSNLAPLWTKPFNSSLHFKHGQNAVQYLKKNNIHEYVGGIPSSLESSDEQWDLPNAWPPLQSIVIVGMYTMEHDECKKLAKEFADNWLNSNMRTYEYTNEMFEKYNAIHPGIQGGGGEYEVQTGFGWSNGVVLELIDIFYA